MSALSAITKARARHFHDAMGFNQAQSDEGNSILKVFAAKLASAKKTQGSNHWPLCCASV